jgi:hypothetical protein
MPIVIGVEFFKLTIVAKRKPRIKAKILNNKATGRIFLKSAFVSPAPPELSLAKSLIIKTMASKIIDTVLIILNL